MSEKRVDVWGSKVDHGLVCIRSEAFISTARLRPELGGVTCEVAPAKIEPPWLKWLPQTLKTLYLSIQEMPRPLQFLALFTIGLICLAIVLVSRFTYTLTWVDIILPFGVWIGILLFDRYTIASWSTAQAMVIRTYIATGSTDLADIKATEMTNNPSAARLILPVFIATALSVWISIPLHLPSLVVQMILIEIVYTIDDKRSWEMIPGFGWASRWLSTNVMTVPPSGQELVTAQYALQRLLQAHRQADLKAALL